MCFLYRRVAVQRATCPLKRWLSSAIAHRCYSGPAPPVAGTRPPSWQAFARCLTPGHAPCSCRGVPVSSLRLFSRPERPFSSSCNFFFLFHVLVLRYCLLFCAVPSAILFTPALPNRPVGILQLTIPILSTSFVGHLALASVADFAACSARRLCLMGSDLAWRQRTIL